jgi:nucleoid DNA-binding protein
MFEETPVKRGRGRPKRIFGEGEVIPKRYRKPDEKRPLTTMEMVKIIGDMTGYTPYESRFFFDAFCAVIHCELVYGRKVIIPGVGNLTPDIKTDFMAYNPLHKKEILIPHSCVVRFKAESTLRNKIRELPKRIAKERIAKLQIAQPVKIPEEEQFI